MILHLVGPSPGALAAPEIAHQIAESGRRVEVILDPRTHHFVGPAAFEGSTVEEPSENLGDDLLRRGHAISPARDDPEAVPAQKRQVLLHCGVPGGGRVEIRGDEAYSGVTSI